MSRHRALRFLGVALLAIPFVPIPRIFGSVRGATGYVGPAEWALGVAIFGTVAWLAASVSRDRAEAAVVKVGRPLARCRAGTLAALGGALLAGLLMLVSWFVFAHRPLLVDGVAQLFQAKIFAAGMLEAPLPPERSHFAILNMVFDESGWYSQYPPGHPLLLTPGVWVGAPWLVPLLLSIGTWFLLTGAASALWDRSTAILTGILLLGCPFFWFMGASFMNHVSALFFLSATLFCLARWEDDGRARWMGLAGAALGGAFLSRPLTAVAVGLVLGLGTAVVRFDRRAVASGVVAFGAVASGYLFYNLATTGDLLVPAYVELWGGAHGLGFHVTPWGEVHTPVAGLRNELLDLSLLNVFLFEWPIPALLPLGVALAAGWFAGDRWAARLAGAFVAIPVAYLFYWHRDAFLGPRYLYSAVAFVVPLTARALVLAWRRTGGSTWGTRLPDGTLLRPIGARAYIVALVGLCAIYAMAWGVPQRFAIHASGYASMKVDLVESAERAGLEPGLVFVVTSWGNRLLAEIYGMGVSASVAERVYRSSDHCWLQSLVDRGRQEGWTPEVLERGLQSAMVPLEALITTTRLNGDPSLRLTPDEPLTERCLEELAHDQGGYTLYVPHLVENRPRLDGEWVVARDLHRSNARLIERYPERPVYRYRPGRFQRLE